MSDTFTAMLPAPRLASAPRSIDAASLSVVVGDELAAPMLAAEHAHDEAQAALDALTSARPGTTGDGNVWRVALDADAAAAAQGETPDVLAVERLLREDPHRYAVAMSLCRAYPRRRDAALRQLDRDAIRLAAGRAAATAAAVWSKASADCWMSRSDLAEAWQRRRAGERALAEYRLAARVQGWASGQPVPPLRRDAVPPTVDDLPDDPVGRGYWLAGGLALQPDTVWLRLPDPLTVRLPDGADDLLQRAVPGSGERFTALRSPDGVHAVDR